MKSPDTLEAIVQLLFISICECVPDVDDIIFTCRKYDWNIRMESDSGDIVLVALIESEEALLCLVVPDLHLPVVTSRNQVGSLVVVAEVNAVYSSLMTQQTEVGIALGGSDGPYFDSLIERCRSKHVDVFWIDGKLHHKWSLGL